jgi:hypothetical protein
MAWIYNQLASLSNLLRLADCIPAEDKKGVAKKPKKGKKINKTKDVLH